MNTKVVSLVRTLGVDKIAWNQLPLAAATYVFAAFTAYVVVASSLANSLIPLIAAAMLCGWCEIDGRCGTSHICTISPLRLLSGRRVWSRAAFAYTLGGLASASVIGALIGCLALPISSASSGYDASTTNVVLSIALTALSLRELNLIRFRLPQVNRQTVKFWIHEYGTGIGPAMWGFHIGLGFATVIKHGGLFAVAVVALVLGPKLGALVMAAFWCGRTMPMWFMCLLPRSFSNAPATFEMLSAGSAAYRNAAAIGIGCIAYVLAFMRIP